MHDYPGSFFLRVLKHIESECVKEYHTIPPVPPTYTGVPNGPFLK